MNIGILPPGDPGVFRSLLLPEMADALAAGEPVTALALTQGDLAVGALAGYLVERQFLIRSLYVAPDYRRCGGGWMLVDALAELLDGCADSMEISFTVTRPEHRILLPFLEATGFRRETARYGGIRMTTLEQLTSAGFFSGGRETGTPFSKLDERVLSRMGKQAMLELAPLPEGGLRSPGVERELSAAVVENGEVQAYVIFETAGEEGLHLSAVWSGSQDPMVLPALLRTSIRKAAQTYPPQTRLSVQTVNEASARLAQALAPQAEEMSYTYISILQS